ncbi:putative polyketide synthase [Cavenderia fasciculata]|uniref:Polyketide synthase n=1 Tax=Cavenderia fasciculata TaxID=261658 RepID=F4QCM4_CACFS|nr:putative polyketide synthase [Cavenderia fasciculata]EGG14452.1 putative polyketide synthase [Cavenderia fasciculata]|eukprot:XP_004353861.1 putative polyketide synthase [Cavenderia fasciculata]
METQAIPIKEQDIAIVGIGCRLPGGSRTPQQFYDQLVDGLDGITKMTEDRWSRSFVDQGYIATDRAGFLDMKEWTHFDNHFFGMLGKEAASIDPQVRLYLSVLWEALEDSHIDPASIRGSNTSVFLGQMYDGNQHILSQDLATMIAQVKTGRSDSSIKASYCYDFRGQSLSIDTACSSSLVAVLQGIDTILKGESDLSICGGVNIFIEPKTSIQFTGAAMIGKKGVCATFDESADGYVRGEGVGVVILKKLSKAIEDNDNIYCVINGGSCNVDGNWEKLSPTAPSSAAQHLNTQNALNKVGVTPSDIYYVECHGTGTPTGDPLEIESISRVFAGSHSQSNPLRIGSVKSNIGHTESTAGVASLIKCAMMLKNRMLIKNINFNKLNPKINLLNGEIKIVLENEPFPNDGRIIRMGINSFGLTGSNAHIILQEYKNIENFNINNNNINDNNSTTTVVSMDNVDYLIPFSSNSQKSIDSYINMIKNNVELYSNKMTFEDFVRYQSQSKTNHPTCKKVIIAKDWETFSSESVQTFEKQQTYVSSMSQLNSSPKPKIVMVFCGQGAQWNGMGERLYQCPIFRNAADRVDRLLSRHYQYSIIDKLRKSNQQEIHHPILAQPATFIIQVALVQLYQHFGITPSIVVGHSFGDITAAWCSGIITLEEAVRIVYLRSVAQNDTIGSGRMLAVSLSFDTFKERFQPSQYDLVELACYNSDNSIVLAGNEDQLKSIDQQLKNVNVFSAFLGTPCAFHSSAQIETKEFIFNNLNNIEYQSSQPTIPYFSTTTSQQIMLSSQIDAQYIYDNLRHPVLFQQTINNIVDFTKNDNDDGNQQQYIYLEIAPHSTLSFYLKSLLPQGTSNIQSPLNKKKDEIESIQSCLSQLYFGGVCVDFSKQLPTTNDNEWKNRSRHLPRYQWDTEYFLEEQEIYKKIRTGGVTTTLLGFSDSESLNTYHTLIDVNRPSYQYLKGHKVKGKYLFPGTGYIENIINAFPNQDIHIHHLQFIAPFFLKEGAPCQLKSTFFQSSSIEYQATFQYYDDKLGKWIKSAVGRLSANNSPTPNPTKEFDSVDQLRQTFNVATMNTTEVYQKLTKVGLMYGESFKRTKQVLFSEDGSILTEIECKSRNHFEESNTVLNASVLDCLLHSCIVTFKGEHPKCEVVFDRVEDFHIYSNNIPKHPCNSLFTTTKLQQQQQQQHTNSQIGNEFKNSIDIIDKDGNTVIKCGQVVCTSLTKVLKVHHAKNPSKFIKHTIWQPKNAPSTEMSLSSSDILGYFGRFLELSTTSHKVIRVLDFGFNYRITIDLFTKLISLSHPNTIIDFITYDDTLWVDLQKDNLLIKSYNPESINKSRSLTDQGFLATSFDLILSTMEYISENNQMAGEFEELLNPNGQLVIINTTRNQPPFIDNNHNNNNMIDLLESHQLNITHNNIESKDEIVLIGRKSSVEETSIEKYDNLLFITPSSSSSSSSSSSLAKRLIQQSSTNLIAKKISYFSNDDIMDESKYQSLLDSISYDSVNCRRVGIIYLESLEEMNSKNLEVKTMQLIRLHQIIRKEQLPIRLITLIASQLNHCLRSIAREYGSKARGEMFHFNSITIILDDSSSQVTLEKILQCANSEYLGESDLQLVCQNNNQDDIQLFVERIIESPQSLELDSKFKVDNIQDLKVNFEMDNKYHLRQKKEIILDDEVEIQVKAASINFKDLMILEGKVDQRLFPMGDIYNPPLGQDCSGVVTRIGPKVTKFKVGDEVYGNGLGFASSTVAFEDTIVLKPKELSFVEAASLPLSMGTACLVLFKKANIYPTESILIHSATGGVGLGMLNLLKFKKHTGKIFVTVGSKEKKLYLEKQYGSFITAILGYDNFTKSITEQTQGKGVDYVINTLDYTRMQDNFKCLSRNGVVVDLSVDQFFQARDIDMGSLNFDKGYLTYHFSRKQMYIHQNIKQMVEEGLEVPPITVFQSHQIGQAFDHVRSRKHIGKVVIDYENVQTDVIDPILSQPHKPVERVDYDLDGIQETLLITGQTGIAVESLGYLVKHSSKLRDIIVVTYSTPKFEIQLLVNELQKKSIKLYFVRCDIGDYDQLKSSVQDLYKRTPTLKPVSVVVHCANTYVTIAPDDIELESHHAAMSGKATGAFNLHNLFEELGWKLNHFHMLSSVAKYIPVDGLSYSIGNAFLDGLSRYRRDLGLESTSINWGSIGQAGKAASDKSVGLILHTIGLMMMPLSAIYGIYRGSFINTTTPITNLICADLQAKSLVSELPHLEHFYSHYLNVANSGNGGNLLDAIGSAGSVVDKKILDFISDALSIEKHLLNGDTKLKDYGVDSMTAIQIKGQIESEFNKPHILNQSHISNGTINSIIESVKKNCCNFVVVRDNLDINMDDDDDLTFEQIKKLQQDRKNNSSNYNTEIVVQSKSGSSSSSSGGRKSSSSSKHGDDDNKRGRKRNIEDEEQDQYDRDRRDNIRNAFDSYTAPKYILDSIPTDPDDTDDPLKEYRPKTVAEQETEYQSRWRKRGLSPPRDYDPFTGKGQVKGRSYKDIMIENQMAKEEKELKEKIERKKREEQTNQRKDRRQQELERERSDKERKESERGERSSHSSSSSSSSSTSSIKKKKIGDDDGNVSSSSSNISSDTKWYLKVYKNGTVVGDPIRITSDRPVTLGRDATKNLVHLEHPSCSSTHASITIMRVGKRPILMDLKSTNQTHLNGTPIDPYHPNDLYQGDKIQFGGSSRDYVIYHT